MKLPVYISIALFFLMLGNIWGSHATRETINDRFALRVQELEIKIEQLIIDNGLQVAK